MTGSLKWHQHRSSSSLSREKNSSPPSFSDVLSFVHYDGKKGITQIHHKVWPCIWFVNFSRGYEFNATPLLYLWIPWVWISVHQVTCELYDNFKNLDALLSTTMELLGFDGLYWVVVKGGGHTDRPTWKRKFSATHWAPEFFPQRVIE